MSADAERIYARARALPTVERAAFLREACRGRPDLRRELLSLLDRAEAAEAFFGRLEGTLASVALSPGDAGEGNAAEAADPDFPPGHAVDGYRIVERIGAGGMGSVYRARDVRLDRDVALKFLPPRAGGDGEASRLLGEARAAAALEHPNVCTVHEIGETAEGRPFIAMAYYRGETLEARLRRGPLPAAEAADVAAQVARGLAAAHTRGIVHRDVKPGNVMLADDGPVRLLDFGLAGTADAALARPAALRGTVPYMSPEQVRGETLDPRSDLWSLGVVLYEMLAGARPFEGETPVELLHAILHADPAPLAEGAPSAPPALARVVHRLLRKAPGDRYPDAGALLADLERAVPPTEAGRSAPSPAGRPTRAAVLGAAGLLLALAAGALWLPGPGEDPAAPGALAGPTAAAPRAGETSVAAWELYVRGSDPSHFRSVEALRRGVDDLERAVALDPGLAPAHAALAVARLVLGGLESPAAAPDEAWERARRAAGRAVALDDGLADAHAALALVRQYADADFAAAEAGLRRAIALDPDRSRLHQWLALLHIQAGRPREALAPAERSLELDPLSPTAHAEAAHALLAAGRHREALARLRAIEGLRPQLQRTPFYAAQALAGLGRWEEAVRAIRPRAAEGDPRAQGLLAYLLARAGRRAEARAVRDTLLARWRDGSTGAFDVAVAHAGLGELDRAFAWLERSAEDRSAILTNFHVMSPLFADLRRDPRFGPVARRLGLPAR